MKFYKCINQVKPSHVVDTEPQFSETVLYENQTSAGEATIILSDNYHNYDIIKFICCDTNTGNSLSSYYTTPATMDHMVADNPYINCNVMNTNHFVTCTITSNTQLTNCTHSRYLYVTKVIGLNCSNGTLVETEIYSGFRTGSWFSIKTELNLFDFNMILAQTCTSGYDENNITNNIYIRPNNNLYLGNTDIANQLTEWRVSYYGNSYIANITEHTISSGKWYYVCGLKFIPNWDYYIENIEFSGVNGQQIPTGIFPFKNGNINRNWQISFKFTEETVSGNSGLVNMVSNYDGSNSNINVWRQGQDYRIIGTQMSAYWSNKTVDIKYTYNGGTSNTIQVYYDGELVSTFALNYSNAQSYLTKELSVGFTVVNYTSYYANGHLDYFGFRWLS